MAASTDVIRAGIMPVLDQSGVDLEALQIQAAGRRELVRVVVDRDGGIDLDLIAELSRQIAEILDVSPYADEFATTYVLEVTSPGVDRPLTEPRHWRRAKQRLVEAQLRDGTVITGRITDADDSSVTIDEQVVALDAIARGMVQVEFNRSSAFNDDDALGEDEE